MQPPPTASAVQRLVGPQVPRPVLLDHIPHSGSCPGGSRHPALAAPRAVFGHLCLKATRSMGGADKWGSIREIRHQWGQNRPKFIGLTAPPGSLLSYKGMDRL